MENSKLQAVIDLLHGTPLPEIHKYLAESPVVPTGTATQSSLHQSLVRPVELALQYRLEPIAYALGANPHELLAFLHPHCTNATACFQRLILLRPDRVWGGERVYICRTVRPLSLLWSGPEELALVLVDGSLEINRSARHTGHGAPAIVVTPPSSIFIAHPSTFIVHHTGITDLIDHAVAAGIPVRLPPLSISPAVQPEFPISPGFSGLPLYADDSMKYPKAW